jgi:hypothetical protein
MGSPVCRCGCPRTAHARSGAKRGQSVAWGACNRCGYAKCERFQEQRGEGPAQEACPGCGVATFPHLEGCAHEARLAREAMEAVRARQAGGQDAPEVADG